MKTTVKHIPEGYRSITPYLTAADASAAIEFYKKIFQARETMRMPAPGGKVGHAELVIGDSKIMIADEFPEMHALGPKAFGGSAVQMHLYVEDVDTVFSRAIQLGAKIRKPVENQFYGDRAGQFEDPFGHLWYVSTHIEDVSPEEMERRSKEMFKTPSSTGA